MSRFYNNETPERRNNILEKYSMVASAAVAATTHALRFLFFAHREYECAALCRYSGSGDAHPANEPPPLARSSNANARVETKERKGAEEEEVMC